MHTFIHILDHQKLARVFLQAQSERTVLEINQKNFLFAQTYLNQHCESPLREPLGILMRALGSYS